MVAYLPGERSVVIGRSPIVGMLLLARDATVTYCHSKTTNLPAVVGEADILIAAVGRPELIKGDWIKPGAVVIDAGYNPGNIGDVEYEAAEARDSLITPVPGGAGPTTIALLLAKPLTRHGQASPEANCGRDSPQTVETSVVVILASGVLACSCPRPAGAGWACPRGMGSARLPVFSAAGRLCSVRLARIEAFKCCPVGTGPGEYERQRWPGLAVDPAGDRAFVVGAGEPIAVVDLRTLAFRYRPWPAVTGAPPTTRTFPRQVQPS